MFGGEAMVFGRAKVGRKLIQKGAVPSGLISIGILASPESHVRWRNYDVSGDMLFIFSPDGELVALVSMAGVVQR